MAVNESEVARRPLACRVMGCRWRFWAEGPELHRHCERCGRLGAGKRYPTAAEAERYARHLDREPRQPVGFFGILSGTLIRERRDREPG